MIFDKKWLMRFQLMARITGHFIGQYNPRCSKTTMKCHVSVFLQVRQCLAVPSDPVDRRLFSHRRNSSWIHGSSVSRRDQKWPMAGCRCHISRTRYGPSIARIIKLIINVINRWQGDDMCPQIPKKRSGLSLGTRTVLHSDQQASVWRDLGALSRQRHLQVREKPYQCNQWRHVTENINVPMFVLIKQLVWKQNYFAPPLKKYFLPEYFLFSLQPIKFR